MIRSRLGLRALVLSALVLGLTAFVTSGVAQATAGAKWTYISKAGKLETFTKTLLPAVSAQLEAGTKAVLHFVTAGGTKVLFECTTLSLEGEPKLLENGSISEGQATFTGCETFLNGVLSKFCLPKTNKGAFDVIQTNRATGLLELHKLTSDGKLDHVIKLTPVTKDAKGNPLAATLELGEECAIGASVPITGSLVVYDCPASGITILKHAVLHLIEEFPALRLLKALGQPAEVLGSAFARLTGEHKEFDWAGLTA
jgi:hypothetical protein